MRNAVSTSKELELTRGSFRSGYLDVVFEVLVAAIE